MSTKKEGEQEVNNKSLSVDIKKRITAAVLLFMFDTLGKLAHNKCKALQVYNQQIKKFDMAPQDKQDVIESEAKLQSLGHVDFVKNLSSAQQKMLRTNPILNFIPWRAVWNGNSVSTPCRLVFDSQLHRVQVLMTYLQRAKTI